MELSIFCLHIQTATLTIIVLHKPNATSPCQNNIGGASGVSGISGSVTEGGNKEFVFPDSTKKLIVPKRKKNHCQQRSLFVDVNIISLYTHVVHDTGVSNRNQLPY